MSLKQDRKNFFGTSPYDWTFFIEEGTLITSSRTTAGTIYTVPAGQTLYLLSAWVSGTHRYNNGTDAGFLVKIGNTIVSAQIGGVSSTWEFSHGQNSITYPCPLKISGGTALILYVGSGQTTTEAGGIIGYLI